jgi:hypothetical protein
MLGYLDPNVKDWNIMVLDLPKVPGTGTGIHFESRIDDVKKKN